MKQKFEVLKIEAADSEKEDLLSHFEFTCNWISEAIENSNGTVLVHCAAGVSRSASIVLAYIMKKFEMDFNEALKFVQKSRTSVSPNSGFCKQLIFWKKLKYSYTGDSEAHKLLRELESTRTEGKIKMNHFAQLWRSIVALK